MRNPIEIQLAWQILELIEAVVDLIWEYYHEDFRRDIKEHEQRNMNEPWKSSPKRQDLTGAASFVSSSSVGLPE